MIFPDKALATRLESSLVQFWLEGVQSFNQLFPDYDATYQDIGGGIAVCTGSQFINTAVGIGLDIPVSNADIDKLEAYFKAHNVPSHIDICSFTDIAFCNLLNERHYYLTDFITAYIHPLDKTQPLPNVNPDIIVEPINSTQNDIWMQTLMDISPHDETTDTRLAQTVTHREHTTCFLAWLDGKAVGASALSIRDGVAFFYSMATRQAYRNLGVQTAMIQTRLAYAQVQGCEMAFAATIPGDHSMRNLMRAGFSIAYVRCTMQKDL
jgi:GNAT superfamily N-acetyltransferase